ARGATPRPGHGARPGLAAVPGAAAAERGASMLVQVNYLKNHKSVNAGPLMSCLCEEVQRAAVDPAHLQVHLDWVQYKKSFRPPVDARRYLLPDGSVNSEREIAIDVRRLVPEEIYILELGVGTGQQAKICLDTLRELCAARGRDYFRRVRYLMSDYSHEVLHAARRTVAEHGEQVSALNVDASDPLHAL